MIKFKVCFIEMEKVANLKSFHMYPLTLLNNQNLYWVLQYFLYDDYCDIFHNVIMLQCFYNNVLLEWLTIR